MSDLKKLKCPFCQLAFAYTPSTSVQVIVCRNCGRKLKIKPNDTPAPQPPPFEPAATTAPPIPEIASSIANETQNTVPADQSFRIDASLSERPKKNIRVSTVIAFLMLALTIFLPLAMVSVGVLIYTNADRGSELGEFRIMDNGVGGIMTPHENEVEMGIFYAALFGAICFPIAPYGLLMLVLVVAFFAFRSAGS